MDVPCPAKPPRVSERASPAGLIQAGAAGVQPRPAEGRTQVIDIISVWLERQTTAEAILSRATPARKPCPDWIKQALDLSIVGFRPAKTPVVISTSRRSPRSTFFALGQDDPAKHGDQIGLGVEYRRLSGHDLILLGHDHIASRLQPLDRRTAAGTGSGGLHRGPIWPRLFELGDGAGVAGRRRRRFVEHHQRLRRHGGVALHHLHIAREGRFLFSCRASRAWRRRSGLAGRDFAKNPCIALGTPLTALLRASLATRDGRERDGQRTGTPRDAASRRERAQTRSAIEIISRVAGFGDRS